MPLALEDLFNFRPVYETAIKGVLETATGGTVFTSQDTTTKDAAPYIEIAFEPGQATGHKHIYAGTQFDDLYNGQLTARVVSRRQGGGQTATAQAYAAKIKAAMIPGRGLFTTSNLPFHQLIQAKLTADNFGVTEDEDCDVITMQWAIPHGIRPEAWAAIGT